MPNGTDWMPPEITGRKEILTLREMAALSPEEVKARYAEYKRNVQWWDFLAMWAWKRDGMPLTRNLAKEESLAIQAQHDEEREKARVAGLEPWELRGEIGEGPFYVDEYSEPPYPIVGDFEWVQEVVTDPTRLEWVRQPVVADEEVETKYVTEGGALYEVTYDPETGEETRRTFVSFVPEWLGESPDELTAWQEVQIERWEADRAIQREELVGLQEWRTLQMEESARARESEAALRREETLAGLTGPRDWIKYWEYKHNVIPQARRRNLLEAANDALQLAQAQPVGSDERLKLEMKAESLFGKSEKFLEWTPTDGARAGRFPETTPPSPQWLPQHLIGDGKVPGVGEPISRLPVRTPSPQLLGGMAETSKLGLAGYADWAAQTQRGRTPSRTWLDILGQMEQMLPTGVRGGQFRRWTSASQRA